MKNMYLENTLSFNSERCSGCGMCWRVCPHAVFSRNGKKAQLSNPARCMECGACQMNCKDGAITVRAGVGCATAMIFQALTGRESPSCGAP